MDKAEALQQAKLDYIKNAGGIAAHPAFWAPFIQLGDSRPIKIQIKASGWTWWLVAAAGLLALAAGAMAIRRKKGQ